VPVAMCDTFVVYTRLLVLVAAVGCGRHGFGDGIAPDARGPYPGPFDGLVAWLPMDHDPAEGVVHDASGHGNRALCARGTACPALVDGVIERGYHFDGTNDFLRIIDDGSLDFSSGWTVAFWAQGSAPGLPPSGTVIGRELAVPVVHFAVRCQLGGDGCVHFYYTITEENKRDAHPTCFLLDGWTHFVASWDGASVQFFQNGVRVRTEAADSTLFDVHDFTIGASEADGRVTNYFAGTLDDLRIYARGLTDPEVAALAGL
jgi:hypothetical protein